MGYITNSKFPASKAQLKLCSDLIDAGAPHELNMLYKPMTQHEASVFINANKAILLKLRREKSKKRRLDEIADRSTPDQYNVPNM